MLILFILLILVCIWLKALSVLVSLREEKIHKIWPSWAFVGDDDVFVFAKIQDSLV